MTKAATLTLISDLSLSQTDATAISDLYDEVVEDMGLSNVIVRASFIQAIAETGQYSLPAAAIKRLYTFYDSIHLDDEKLINLEAINDDWRDEVGTPNCVTEEDEDEDTFTIYPAPPIGSTTVAGADLGANFVVNSITSIHTNDEADLPVWLELPIAYTVLGMEFIRESDHHDEVFAKACFGLAQLLWTILGIDFQGVPKDMQNG